jgi:leader peptidase (prepilin peptidase)/N-methyltransferase
MEIAYAITFAFIGLCVGSFLNVVADRLPAGESIVSPPSHCPGCGRKIGASDLIPVLSYLILRGRCRECGSSIPKRVPIIEAVTGGIFVLLYLRYGLILQTGILAFYFCIFLTVLVTDLEHQIIPNKITYPSAVIALIISSFTPGIGIVSALIGGGAGLIFFAVVAILARLILKKEAMGMGDIKLIMLIGFATGFPMVIVAIYLAIISGGVVAVILVLTKLKKMKDMIAYGVFLSAAAMVTLIWGPAILNWYLALYGF